MAFGVMGRRNKDTQPPSHCPNVLPCKTLERMIWFLESNVLLLTSSVASGANGVQLIILSVLKRLFVKLSSRKNIRIYV